MYICDPTWTLQGVPNGWERVPLSNPLRFKHHPLEGANDYNDDYHDDVWYSSHCLAWMPMLDFAASPGRAEGVIEWWNAMARNCAGATGKGFDCFTLRRTHANVMMQHCCQFPFWSFVMLQRWKAATSSPGFPPSPGFPEASLAKEKSLVALELMICVASELLCTMISQCFSWCVFRTVCHGSPTIPVSFRAGIDWKNLAEVFSTARLLKTCRSVFDVLTEGDASICNAVAKFLAGRHLSPRDTVRVSLQGQVLGYFIVNSCELMIYAQQKWWCNGFNLEFVENYSRLTR